MSRLEATRLGVPERGLLVHRTIPQLLAPATLVPGRQRDVDALLAWGRRPSARRVERLGQHWNLPVWHLEDGFLRSCAKGREHPPLCLLVDDLGVHFDIAPAGSSTDRHRAHGGGGPACRSGAGVGAASPQQAEPGSGVPGPRAAVRVGGGSITGDLSIPLGLADRSSFCRMLQAALDDHPDSLVVVKLHPDVLRRRARGHFDPADLNHPRIRLSADGLHPAALLEQAEAIYVVTSQMGFEALLWGRPVHCFGMPFYAGWGLTHDRCRRRSAGVGCCLLWRPWSMPPWSAPPVAWIPTAWSLARSKP